MTRYVTPLKTIFLILMLIAQLEVGYNFGLTSRGIGRFLITGAVSFTFLASYLLISVILDAAARRERRTDRGMILPRMKGDIEQVTSLMESPPKHEPDASAVVGSAEGLGEREPPRLLAERHALRAMKAERTSGTKDVGHVAVPHERHRWEDPDLAAMIGLTEGFTEEEPPELSVARRAPSATRDRRASSAKERASEVPPASKALSRSSNRRKSADETPMLPAQASSGKRA